MRLDRIPARQGGKKMINEEATFEKFGYYARDLKPQSAKKIVAVCDDCGKVRISPKSHYHARCISCANKGERNHNHGKHHSEDTRKKLSDARKGKHPSEEARKKMSDARKGEKNANWRNGTSFEPYCEKFNEPFKEYIREKFGRVCFLCSKTEEENGKRLSVHHVNGNKNCGCDGDETCQFIPLCAKCHSKVHSKKVDWEKRIKDKMRNSLKGWVI